MKFKSYAKTTGLENKMQHFRWIASLIIVSGEEAIWVVGGPGVASQNIEKITLNFEANALLTLARHKLCPTTEDNVLSPIHVSLISGLMVG